MREDTFPQIPQLSWQEAVHHRADRKEMALWLGEK